MWPAVQLPSKAPLITDFMKTQPMKSSSAKGRFAPTFGARQENALILRQSPRWMQSFALMLAIIGGAGLLVGYFVRIDEVVSATGQLESTAGRVDVKSPVGGKIARLLVRDGVKVRKGELLLVMDTDLAKERIAESDSLISLEREGLRRQLSSLEEQLRLVDRQIATQLEITTEYENLAKTGGVARIQALQQRDRLIQLETQRSTTLDTMQRSRVESEKTIRQILTQLKEAVVQKRYQNLTAPSDGVVFDLKVQPDGVVQEGAVLMTLVPQGGLRATVNISNKDIGFVKIGQEARVRVDAYPSNRYGELQGKVKLVAADALPPDATVNYYRFPVQISLAQSYLMADNLKIPLSSGMSISANLRIRDKPLISLVSDLFSGQFDSLRSLRQ